MDDGIGQLRLALTLCSFLLSPSLHAINDTVFSGYLKSFVIAQEAIDNPVYSSDKMAESQNSIRLMVDSVSDRYSWQIHYELISSIFSEYPQLDNRTLYVSPDTYRISDPDRILADSETRHPVYQNLDRLNLQIRFDSGDLTLGRQAITFGSARFINPSDVLLPFDIRTFNKEYRSGVDAIRYQMPVGNLGEVDTGLVFGQDARSEQSAAYFNLRAHLGTVDIQNLLLRFSRQNLFALGLETNIGDAGFWLESARVWGESNYTRSSVGLDYSFGENTFMQAEYHYNSLSSGKSEDYISLLMSQDFRNGGIFLLGRQYLLVSLAQRMSPLWQVSTSLISNLDDDSRYLSFSAEHSLSENLYLSTGVYLYSGKDLAPASAPPYFSIESEFGSSPNLLFVSLKYYF